MAFIIALSLNRLSKHRLSGSGILVLLCLLSLSVYAAGEFRIISLETHLNNKVYQLSANIQYTFSKEALEALEHGVPLLILVDIEVLKKRWYWDKKIASLEQGYLLLYHALSEGYIIHNLNSGTQDNYANLGQALARLGRMQRLPILDANLLEKDEDYYVRIRTLLDIESLPTPMRPLAYISNEWQLQSDWYEWPLQN